MRTLSSLAGYKRTATMCISSSPLMAHERNGGFQGSNASGRSLRSGAQVNVNQVPATSQLSCHQDLRSATPAACCQ